MSRSEPSQGHDAYARLLAEIRSGHHGPGDRLTETDLAALLGISRTPVREAIRHLEADGLVTHTPCVGAKIRVLDYDEITEIYEMLAVLEGTAAGFAARAAYDAEIAELEAITADMGGAKRDPARLFAANRQFHAVLLEAARNRFLRQLVEAVQKTLLILGRSTMEESTRAETAIAEHGAIIDALKAHDGACAEAAMRTHIEGAHRARLCQIRKGQAQCPHWTKPSGT